MRVEAGVDRVDVIPLNFAVVCLDCSNVTNSPNRCRACGSAAVLSLAAILDRRPEPVREEARDVAVV